MKPSSFEYIKCSSMDETVRLLHQFGDSCKIIAGGQSLVPLMNMRLTSVERLIDINDVSDLDYIREDGQCIQIGSITRQKELEFSEIIKSRSPILAEAVRNIGHPQIRARGTVGGSLAHADPAAELALVFLTLDAELVLSSVTGDRNISIDDFLISEFATSLKYDEIIREIQFKVPHFGGFSFEEFSIRRGDFAIASASCLMNARESGEVEYIRVGIGGITPRPVVLKVLAEKLIGKNMSEDLVQDSLSSIDELAETVSGDIHSSPEFKINICKTIVNKTIWKAYDMATNNKGGES